MDRREVLNILNTLKLKAFTITIGGYTKNVPPHIFLPF